MPAQIEIAKQQYAGIEFREGNLLAINQNDESHDAAFVFGVIHHIPESAFRLEGISTLHCPRRISIDRRTPLPL